MKKKLALLLVLTMILSAIPMNVFGATQIVRGPLVTEASNTYAIVRVDLGQLVSQGLGGRDTNAYYDSNGYKGLPIDINLGDPNGAGFGFDWSLDIPGDSAVSANADNVKLAAYYYNALLGFWDTIHGSARATTIDTVNGIVSASTTTHAAIVTTAFGAKEAELTTYGDKATLLSALKDLTTGASFASTSYVTKWSMTKIDADTLRYYIQIANTDPLVKGTKSEYMLPDRLPEGQFFVEFAVPIALPNRDAVEKATLSVVSGLTGVQLATGPAANFAWYANYTVGTGTKAVFANTGFLDTVTIKEASANYLNSNTVNGVITGAAKNVQAVEFRFNTPYARLVNNTYEPLKFEDYANTFEVNQSGTEVANASDSKYNGYVSAAWGLRSYAGTTANAGYPGYTGDYKDYDLRINFLQRNNAYNVADTLSLKNLMVAFDERMAYGTDVVLQYRSVLNDGTYAEWSNTNAVVTRTENTMGLGYVTGRSTHVEKAALDKVAVSGRNNTTEVIRLKEVVSNSWNTGATTFTVPEGVEIVGAHASIWKVNRAGATWTKLEGTTKWYKTDAVTGAVTHDPNGAQTSDTNGSDDYVSVLRHQDINNGASIVVNERTLTIRPLANYAASAAAGETRELELQLNLSVEAGYVEKYGAETIDLTVESTADVAETIAVANVHDPITATLDAEVLELPTEANFNVQDYVIGDIVISEHTPGDLKQSSELWLYVVGSSNLDLTLDAVRRPTILNDDTYFAIYDGVQLRHRYGNFFLNGLRFDIQRASSANGPSGKTAAAEFSIDDVTLTGVIQPGSQYTIVVSGSAVASNDYTVIMNGGDISTQTAADAANDAAGVFDSEPYTLDPFTWDAGAYQPPVGEAPPAEDGATGPIATISAPKTFNAYSYSYDVDANGNPRSYNNFYMGMASNGQAYAGISPRAFAEFVNNGVDTTQWDATTNTATITGTNFKTGEEVVVELTLDSTTAVVNGVSTDIAEYNNVLDAYPVGSIKPFNPNGRMYLPIRFLCNAFQVEFSWDDVTKSVTLNPAA